MCGLASIGMGVFHVPSLYLITPATELVQSWNGLLKAALRGLQNSTDDNNNEDSQDEDLVQKLAELTVSVMQGILGDPKVHLVPTAEDPTALCTVSKVNLAPQIKGPAAPAVVLPGLPKAML